MLNSFFNHKPFNPAPHTTLSTMTRGHKPLAAIRDAKKFAEKMGYRLWENRDNPELAYDFSAFKEGYAMLVKVRVLRNHISTDTFYEDLLADNLREVRALPCPTWLLREIWLRTQHERVCRRIRVLGVAVAESGFWNPDEYVNPHAR